MGLLDQTLGPAFVGCLISATLYGITCSQAFIFSRRYPDEKPLVKLLIGSLVLMDTLHAVFVTHASYWYMITNFLNPQVLTIIPWSLWASQLIGSTADMIVRLFFAYRVWILSKKNIWLVLPIFIICMVAWVDTIALSFMGFTSLHTIEDVKAHSWMFYVSLSFLIAGDAYFATTLSYFLYRGKSHVSSRTNYTVRSLLWYTVNTGIIAIVFSLTCLLTYALLPKTSIYLAMYFPLSQLYISALLASLNARSWLRLDLDNVQIPLKKIMRNPSTQLTLRGGIPVEMNIPTHSYTSSTADRKLSLDSSATDRNSNSHNTLSNLNHTQHHLQPLQSNRRGDVIRFDSSGEEDSELREKEKEGMVDIIHIQ